MIDKKDIEVYKSIKAPDSLKDKVLSYGQAEVTDKKRVGMMRLKPVVGLVACLVLVIGLSAPMFGKMGSGNVYIYGEKVGQTPVCVSTLNDSSSVEDGKLSTAAFRMKEMFVIPITLGNEEPGTLSVSEGVIQLLNAHDELVTQSETVQKESNQSVQWIFSGFEPDTSINLTVTEENYEMTYQVYQEETSGLYYIKLKDKVKR